MTNIVRSLTYMSMAYKMVALQLLIGEANFFSQQLKLSTSHPIQATDLSYNFIAPPRFGFGARITVGRYDFSFKDLHETHESRLWQIVNKVDQVGVFDRYPKWKKSPLILDDKGAYQLATQWLAAVWTDVPALEKKFKPHVTRPFWYNPGKNDQKEILPVFEIQWGDNDPPAVSVTILGTTKELMLLTFNDLFFSKRAPLVISNADELNKMPDPGFKKFNSGNAPLTNRNMRGETNLIFRTNASQKLPEKLQ